MILTSYNKLDINCNTFVDCLMGILLGLISCIRSTMLIKRSSCEAGTQADCKHQSQIYQINVYQQNELFIHKTN